MACPGCLVDSRLILSLKIIVEYSVLTFPLQRHFMLLEGAVMICSVCGIVDEREIIVERIKRSVLDNLLPKSVLHFIVHVRSTAIVPLGHLSYGVVTVIHRSETSTTKTIVHHVILFLLELKPLISLFQSQCDEQDSQSSHYDTDSRESAGNGRCVVQEPGCITGRGLRGQRRISGSAIGYGGIGSLV